MAAVTVIIPCRNKAAHVGRCVQSFLDQTVDDFQLIISDQGSEDGSAVEIALTLAAYGGSKKLTSCVVRRRSIAATPGLDAHLNWLHQHVTGDLVIMCSADDFVHPQRVERTRWAFETFNPSYVSTRLEYKTPEGAYAGETGFPDRCSRWIAPAECFQVSHRLVRFERVVARPVREVWADGRHRGSGHGAARDGAHGARHLLSR